jgi:hypothetical protein
VTARSISSRGREGSEGATASNRVVLRREARKFLVSPCLVPASLGIQEACQRQPLCCTRLGGGPGQGRLRALARQNQGTPPSSQPHVIWALRLRQKASAKFVDNLCGQEAVFCRDSTSHLDSRWISSLSFLLLLASAWMRITCAGSRGVKLPRERLFAYRHLFALPALWAGVWKRTVRRVPPCNIRRHLVLSSPLFCGDSSSSALFSRGFLGTSVAPLHSGGDQE